MFITTNYAIKLQPEQIKQRLSAADSPLFFFVCFLALFSIFFQTSGAHFGGTLKIRDLTADRKAANYTGAHYQPEKTLRGAK